VGALELVSVNVGRPAWLGLRHGEAVISAIVKRRVDTPTIVLSELNLDGDEQADKSHHGGGDLAVYAYPVEHLARWSAELERTVVPADFGENLTVRGTDESVARVGDVWEWGDALLQISQPRMPCYKLAMRLQRPDIIRRMERAARTGWYMRILRPAMVPVAGPLRLASRGRPGMEIRNLMNASRGLPDADLLATMIEDPALGGPFRRTLGRRLQRARENAA
jgi:MOSC domain-containing protein YiiM